VSGVCSECRIDRRQRDVKWRRRSFYHQEMFWKDNPTNERNGK